MPAPPRHGLRPWVAALGCAVAWGCGPASAPGGAPPGLEGFEPCRQAGAGGVARCGVVEVPRDPARPEGETLGLRVVILPALEDTPAAPLYLLAGGPGQGAVEAFAPLLPALAPLRDRRPLVLVDARGTGASAPMDCPVATAPAELLRATPDPARLEACLAALPLRPDEVSTGHLVADLEAVRRTLGHQRIALAGGSYGTRLALEYLRVHAERVEAAILDGVAPPQMVLFQDFARDAQAAWDAHVAACAADPACGASYPELADELPRALARLADGPVEVLLSHPRTAEPVTVTLSRDVAAGALRGLLYGADLAPLLPYTVHQAAAGRWQPLVGQALTLAEAAAGSLSQGMMLCVVCAEDVARLDRRAAARAASGTFMGEMIVDLMQETCALWPTAELPLHAGEPVHSPVPTLLLSGALDPVTPPRWAALAAQTLPNARSVVLPRGAHGTMGRGCVPELMARFLEAPGRLADLDTSCVDQIPALAPFIDIAGPTP